jgi:hypothetical protein
MSNQSIVIGGSEPLPSTETAGWSAPQTLDYHDLDEDKVYTGNDAT